jgi:hypothetical protein
MQSILLILLCQFSLDPVVTWELPEPQKGGDPQSTSSVADSIASVQQEAAGEGFYAVMYTASWCGPCQAWKSAGNVQRMRDLGYPLTIVDIDENPQYRGSVPRFEIVERGTGRRVWQRIGGVSPETIVANVPADTPAGPLVSRPARTTHTSAGDSATVSMQWSFEGSRSPSTEQMASHLSEHGVDASGMTRQQMADVHDQIHNGGRVPLRQTSISQSVCPTCPQPQLQRRGGRFFGIFGR